MEVKELSELSEKRMNQLGIKKSHVAKKIGCTPMEFSHFLKNRRKLRQESIEKLIQYLQLH